MSALPPNILPLPAKVSDCLQNADRHASKNSANFSIDVSIASLNGTNASINGSRPSSGLTLRSEHGSWLP
eukprot:588686-Rhodomonas_salina.3